jgi:nucleoside-diphosphate-sugar epimerase
MNIIMTGHHGYIGSHLAPYLEEKGHIVYGYNGDVRKFNSRYHRYGFDMVIHLAALVGVRKSLDEQEEYWDVNVNGTKAVFDWCKEHNAKCLYASSSNAIEWWTNPYAMTKKVNEHDGKDFVGFRPHTVFPGREDMLYDRMKNNPKSVKYIYSQHCRDWTHIEDLCSGLFTLIENYDIIVGKVIDIGTGESISLKEVAAKMMPMYAPQINFANPPHERVTTCADTTILKELGWTPKQPRVVLK